MILCLICVNGMQVTKFILSGIDDFGTKRRLGNCRVEMESKDKVSDSDSGVILQSGSDSPQSVMKGRCCSVILRKQMLEETLEARLDELKKLCLRESELVGYLPKEYPLADGEEPPPVRRRIGASFQLDELTITPRDEDSELDHLERVFALQLQFVEAAKRLSQEGNLSRHIRKQRKHAYMQEQKKLNEIKNDINKRKAIASGPTDQVRNVVEELSASDDSSLEDDTRQHHSQCSSTEFLSTAHAAQRSNSPLPPLQSSRPTPPQTLEGLALVCYQGGDCKKSPIMDAAWTESNLDEPYEKIKRRSSLNSKTSSSTVTPPESVQSDLSALHHFEMRGMPYLNPNSASAPSTPEMRGRIHHQCTRSPTVTPSESALSDLSALRHFEMRGRPYLNSNSASAPSTPEMRGRIHYQDASNPTVTPSESALSDLSALRHFEMRGRPYLNPNSTSAPSTPEMRGRIHYQDASSPAVTPSESVQSDLSALQHFEMRGRPYLNPNSTSAPSTPEMRGRIHYQDASPAVTPSESGQSDRSALQHFEMRGRPYLNPNSASAPLTPEMRERIHYQDARYLDVSPFPATPDQRGRSLHPQRRTTNYTVIVPDSHTAENKTNESLHMRPCSLSGYACSEPNSSGTSTYIAPPIKNYAAAPRYWQVCNLPANVETPALPGHGYYWCNPNQPFSHYRAFEHTEGNAMGHTWENHQNRQYNAVHHFNPPLCQYNDEKNSLTVQRITPSHCRIVRTPSLKEHPNRTLQRNVVSEELQSWHERTRQRNGRPHSLDRQGAFRGPRTQNRSREQYMRWPALPLQRPMPHWMRDHPQYQWYTTEEAKVASQF
ncbi:innate immunity activator b isoform X3 [Narcine bancroftii]|uniref:innate immunity activator b isoform X3 n=1 Tax=Narcine bancroftii TaxID=1343680 RepID=UPI0038315229